jgi:hypothetical protein
MQHHDNNDKRQAAVGVSECGVSEGRDRWGSEKVPRQSVRRKASQCAGGKGPAARTAEI